MWGRKPSARHGAKADLDNPGVVAAPGAVMRDTAGQWAPEQLTRPAAPSTSPSAAGVGVGAKDTAPAGRDGEHSEPRGGRVPFAAPAAPAENEQDTPPELARRRRLWGRRRRGTDAGVEEGVMELPAPQGYVVRRSARRARRGGYAPLTPPALTSTRQAEILNTALVAAPTDAHGIINGKDMLSNTPVAHDPFTAYEEGTITSPNVTVLGVIGAGKSSLIKTVYVLRPLILRHRRAVVMDKKDRGGEGEYCELARELGSEPFRMVIDEDGEKGTTLNLLDPAILAGGGRAGQYRLLRSMAELSNDGLALEKWEKKALRAAHKATLRAAEHDGQVPVLEDLLRQLGRMHPDFDEYSMKARERIHQAGLGVHQLLEAMVADELCGLFDGPTSREVRLADKLTVFDVSQLPDDGPAVSMVMTVANVWLLGTLRNQRGLRTNFIAEEGWNLVGGPGGRVFQSNAKLSRGLGLSNIAAIHHVADIPEDDPAIAMLKEAQTVHLYRQDRAEDIDAITKMYTLDPGSAGTLPNLGNGHHLLKIGNRREIHVEHVRSQLERGLTNTDAAMVFDPATVAGR